MGHKMLLPGRRLESLVYSLNVIGFLLIALPLVAISQADSRELDWKRSEKRVNQIVASELLRPSILTTPIGQFTKTTRTFVQDGASTEYVTEILGSTFDGRGYAQILSTSSRIFYEKDNSLPEQTSPYLVYPSASLVQNKWKLDDGISASKPSDVILSTPSLNNQIDQLKNQENDIFEEKLEFNNDLDKKFQPSRPLVNLPTYTVKHDTVKLSNSDFDFEKDIIHDEDVKPYRVKTPKMLNSEVIQDTPKNEPLKSLETITYYGFADFMTTVGRTVIVFSPSTASSTMERIATTIAGDATLRSADSGGVMPFTSSIQATRAYPKSTSVIVPDEINPTTTLKTIESTSSINIIDDQENMYSTTPGDMDDSQMLFNLSDDNDSSNTESPSYEQKDIKDDSSKTSVVQSVSRKVTSSSNNPESTTMDENLTGFDDDEPKFTVLTSKNSSNTTLTTVSPLNSEDINDIVNLSGRKLNGCKSKNLFGNNDKELLNDCTTILTPSSTQRVFTDRTTIFIDDIISEDNITTSIEPSKTIDTSSSTYQTQETSDINLLQKSQTSLLSTIDLPVEIINSTDSVYDEIPVTKREEYELIFKTLYTTYTYLTTFFQDSTSNVSSREVIETNVITQTVQYGDSTDEITSITPTKPLDMELRKTSTQSPLLNEDDYEEFMTDDVMASKSIVTDPTPSTIQTKYIEEAPIEGSFDESINLEPSPMLVDGVDGFETKTYFTTYTYFTTVFVDDEIEIDTRTEVFSNIVTEPMKTTTKMEIITTKINDMPTTPANMKPKQQAAVPLEILAYLEALKNKKSQEEKLVTPTQEITPSQNATVSSSQTETSQKMIVTETNSTDKDTLKSIISGISSTSTSSDGPRFVSYIDKDVEVSQDDQELSESNHHDVEPVPTVILRTSYTTFTYFTTMYKGEDTNVVSRLETVTKVMTETVGPTMAIESPVALETSSLPVTYFTTFTYWTTYYHAGSTVTTSREETVSNLITPGVSPTPRVQLGVIQTYRPDLPTMTLDGIEKVRKEDTDNEVMRQDRESLNNTPQIQTSILTPSMIEDKKSSSSDFEVTSTVNIEPTTYYTTFTYFTTSYLGNQTILNSRHETITNVALGDISKATGRAINLPASNIQNLQFEDKIRNVEINPTKTVDESKIGILSTIRSSKISDETTTHFLTDVYGTYIDGLYAQLVRSSISLEGPKSSQTTTAINLGSSDILNKTVFLNEGTIIDADEITTIYFTTSQFVKPVDNTYTTLIESTSSTKIDIEKNKTLTSSKEAGHKTGLVRLIKGQIKTNGETLLYQSKVIGTSIDGRYAQIIESTTSYLISPTSISPSVTETQYSTTGILSPSPEVLQGSKPSNKENEPVDESDDEGQKDDEGNSENEEEDDNDTSKKKSRLTFSSRKRTFTPIIRPFLSRNRPNFNPLKRKNAQGATTITRSDITPTITATLAASKNSRFLSSRGRPVSSLSSSSSSAASISPSRRFSGRKSFTSTSSTPSFTSSVRGRASGRISSSPTFGGDRRFSSTIKGSFAKPLNRGSSSLYVGGGSSRYRGPIRSTSVEQSKPTPSSTRSYQSAKYDSDQDNDANEPFMTTLSSIENLNNNSDDLKSETKEITETIPVELPKKKNNLVKSRISPNRSPKSSLIPATSSRKNIWSQTTVPSVINNASINFHLQNVPHGFRKENDNNRFSYESTSFPNLSETDEFLDNTEARSKINSQIERINYNQDNQNTETINNDYEGSSSTTDELKKIDNTYQDSQVFKRPNNPRLSNRFVVKRRRIRRQANQLRSYQSNRYRKLGSLSTSTESGIDSSNTGSNDVLASKSSSLQNNGKNRIISSALPRNNEKQYSETSELRTRSKIRPATNQRVQPSSKSNGRQFTLREKSTTVPPTSFNSKQENFRRPTKSRGRLSTKRTTETTFEPSRKGTSRTSSTRTRNTSRRTSQKGLSRSRDDISANKENEKITVTHYIPTEATIPVLNNGETEYRNVITGSPSIEVLNPNGYSTIIGVDGKESLIIATESSGINQNGQTEFTQFVLHSTPTSRVSHTLVTLGGRRVSQSLIVPSTIYSVENIISTLPAEKINAESQAPLANLLLSQLLLNQFGQLNKANLLLGASETKIAEAVPTTSYNTRTTTYVTTLTKEQSTVIPLTFRGKEILTTLIDHSTEVVTATEFVTDTVVITPTSTLPAANLDSLLYLLNQSPQGLQQPIKSPLVLMTPTIIQSEIFANEGERQYQSLNLYDEQVVLEPSAKEQPAEQSVITVYVSGKRPGEFRTVLSTVKLNDAMSTRNKRNILTPVESSIILQTLEQPEATSTKLSPSEELPNTHIPTQSLESIVGDVGRHIFGSTNI